MPWFAKGRGAISMIRTSNPEAAAIQNLQLADGHLLYEHITISTRNWNIAVQEKPVETALSAEW